MGGSQQRVDGDPRTTGLLVGGLVAASVALLATVGFLGPSVAEPPLPLRGSGPPFFVDAHPSPWLVLALLAGGLGSGAAALLVGLRGLRRQWRPRVGALVLAGVVGAAAFLFCPTLGSADYTNYSAYGHIENRGLDAYLISPLRAAQLGVPTAASVERPWQKTQSVYGPTSLRIEQVAAWLGGNSLKRTSMWLSILHCAAFLLTGAVMLTMATTDAAKRRVGVMWFANPLMIYELVAGSHVDALVVLFVVSGLAVFRRSRLMAGFLVGLGVATKVNAALVGGAMAWVERRSWRKAAALAAGAAVSIGGLYLTAGPHALDQTRRASRFVSPTTPWLWPIKFLRHAIGNGAAQLVMTLGVAVVAVLVGRAIFVLVPRRGDDPGTDAVRSSTGYSLAWLFSAAYLLPWYDSMAWGTLPLVDEGPLDVLLVAHTTLLAFATLPGRDLHFPTAYNSVVVALHSVISPLGVLAIILVVLRLGRRGTRIDAAAGPAPPVDGPEELVDLGRLEPRSAVDVDGLR